MAASAYQKVASFVAKNEGKKSQAKVGDIREILKILVQTEAGCMKKRELGPLGILMSQSFSISKLKQVNVVFGSLKRVKPRKKPKAKKKK